jgi:hypothetical protein
MSKNRNQHLKIPLIKLTWKHIYLIIFVILAFRLDANSISSLLQWIMDKYSR